MKGARNRQKERKEKEEKEKKTSCFLVSGKGEKENPIYGGKGTFEKTTREGGF